MSKQESYLSAILRKVPGFGGYVDQEQRRESDQQTRDWIVRHLENANSGLEDYIATLAEAGHIDDLPICEKLRTSIQHLAGRVRSQTLGYSGLFDAGRIDEDRLEDVYDRDARLLDETEELSTRAMALRNESGPTTELIRGLLEKTESIWHVLDERAALLEALAERTER